MAKITRRKAKRHSSNGTDSGGARARVIHKKGSKSKAKRKAKKKARRKIKKKR